MTEEREDQKRERGSRASTRSCAAQLSVAWRRKSGLLPRSPRPPILTTFRSSKVSEADVNVLYDREHSSQLLGREGRVEPSRVKGIYG
jgi:hypothetical protein